MIFVVARNYREAEWYLGHRDPPVSPRSKGVLILCTNNADVGHKLRGLRPKKGDEVIYYYKYYEGQYYTDLIRDLRYIFIGAEVTQDEISTTVDRI